MKYYNFLFLCLFSISIMNIIACSRSDEIKVITGNKTEKTIPLTEAVKNCIGLKSSSTDFSYSQEVYADLSSEIGAEADFVKQKIIATARASIGDSVRQTFTKSYEIEPNHQGKVTVLLKVVQVEGTVSGNNTEIPYTATFPTYTFEVSPELEECVKTIHIEAEEYVQESAHVSLVESGEGGRLLGYLNDGEQVKFENIDFGAGGHKVFRARIASAEEGGEIEIRVDEPDGEKIGVCKVPNTGGWRKWETVTCDLRRKVMGTTDVYLLFHGGDDYLFNINWIEFSL